MMFGFVAVPPPVDAEAAVFADVHAGRGLLTRDQEGVPVEAGVEQRLTCSPAKHQDGFTSHVYYVNDSRRIRCFVANVPNNATGPLPVLLFAHGSGGNAHNCYGALDHDT